MIVFSIIVVLITLLLVSANVFRCAPRSTEYAANKKIPLSHHIVVAKYREDVSWLRHFQKSKVFVYDKSGEACPRAHIQLENKGREGSTFLGHIVDHYDNLPDYTIILQGDPFPHMAQGVRPENLEEKILEVIRKNPPQKTEPLFCDWHREQKGVYQGLIVDQYYSLMFEGDPGKTNVFAAGNQYIIPRDIILTKPKGFYYQLWKMAIKGTNHTNHDAHFGNNQLDPTEIMGWSLERIFPIIVSDTPVNQSFLHLCAKQYS